MKKTKILATLGPSVDDEEKISALVAAGANAFRINMSHGTHEQWARLIGFVRRAAPNLPIVMDTKGPELRLRNVKETVLEQDEEFTISQREHNDMPYLSHFAAVSVGQQVLIDDGSIVVEVISVENDIIRVRTHDGGLLTDLRKVTVPGARVDLPVLTEADFADLSFCREHGIDALAASFTQSAADVKEIRKHIDESVMIIAKIESLEGLNQMDEIIAECDAVMIARGDLGVEIPLEDVPLTQKKIIRICNAKAKPVIVATQMLESMISNNRPTRAEASDVANAILDGADCLMLSAETAVGKYPIHAVSTMCRICQRLEDHVETSLDHAPDGHIQVDEAISYAVWDLSLNIKNDAIITATSSGFTTRMISRFRPKTTLIAVARSQVVRRQLNLSWGVEAVLFHDNDHTSEETVYHAISTALAEQLIKGDDMIIATAGISTQKSGSTNMIEVHEVSDFMSAQAQKRG